MADLNGLYILAISVCEAACECSDRSTPFERDAIEAIEKEILPNIRMRALVATQADELRVLIDSAGTLSAACNTVISALNGSNEQERNVIANAKTCIRAVERNFREMGIDITIPIATYGKPIPEAIINPPKSQVSSSSSSYSSSSSGGAISLPQHTVPMITQPFGPSGGSETNPCLRALQAACSSGSITLFRRRS